MRKYLILILLTLAVAEIAQAGVSYQNCTYHAYRDCFGSNVYWYSSCGVQQELIQICQASNQICKFGQCVYQPAPLPAPQPKLAPVPRPVPVPTPAPAPRPEPAANISATFFAKKDSNAVSWDKSVQVGQNSTIYFLVVLKNTSTADINNIIVSAVIPQEVALLGNLKIDDVQTQGDIVSGIVIPSLPQNSAKSITFDGKTQAFSATGEKQATVNVIVPDSQTQFDSLTLNLNPSIQPAEISKTPVANPFVEFLKKWYLWIIVAAVLIALFVIIFRRLSTES